MIFGEDEKNVANRILTMDNGELIMDNGELIMDNERKLSC